jgi:hypothetical protein
MMMRLTVTGPSKFGVMLSRTEEGLCGVLVMHCASFYLAARQHASLVESNWLNCDSSATNNSCKQAEKRLVPF